MFILSLFEWCEYDASSEFSCIIPYSAVLCNESTRLMEIICSQNPRESYRGPGELRHPVRQGRE